MSLTNPDNCEACNGGTSPFGSNFPLFLSCAFWMPNLANLASMTAACAGDISMMLGSNTNVQSISFHRTRMLSYPASIKANRAASALSGAVWDSLVILLNST